MLRERYEYKKPNGSGSYVQPSRPRTLLTDAEGGHSTCRFYYLPASSGGKAEVCAPHAPSR